MKTCSQAIRGGVALLLVAIASCRAAKEDDNAPHSSMLTRYLKMPKLPPLEETPVARLMPAGGLKVVEVREKELKEMPTGQERAAKFRKERKSGFWIFGGPLHFEEPPLPEGSGELDGSLLPPPEP